METEMVQLATDEDDGDNCDEAEGRQDEQDEKDRRIRQKCRGQNDVVTKIAEYKIPSSGDANDVQQQRSKVNPNHMEHPACLASLRFCVQGQGRAKYTIKIYKIKLKMYTEEKLRASKVSKHQ